MRTSTIVALAAVAAASTPALAAPRAATRDVDSQLLARELLSRASSGAFNIHNIGKLPPPSVLNGVRPLGLKLITRDQLELDIVARETLLRRAAIDESGALSFQDVKDFGKGFVQGFTGTIEKLAPIVTAFLKREDLELIARRELLSRAVVDESGAISFQDVKDFGKGFVQGFTGTIEKLAPLVTAFIKREELELLARQEFNKRATVDESGAISFQDVKDFGKGFVQGFTGTIEKLAPLVTAFIKRDELDLMARQEMLRRATIDESGAISFQDVKDFGKGFVQGFTGTIEKLAPIVTAFLKREDLELIARHELLSRAVVDESGALSFQDVKDFGKGFVQGFTGTIEKLAPLVTAFIKREELELMAREEFLKRATVDESGAISFQDVKDFGKGFVQGFTGTIEKLAPIVTAFLKREEFELMAREAYLSRRAEVDASGALSFQDVKDFGKGFVQGFTGTLEKLAPIAAAFIKREHVELMAREMYHFQARQLADGVESGALSFDDVKNFAKDFGKGFVQGFTGTLKAVAPVAAAFIKREDMDLLAREVFDAVYARSLAELD